MLETGTPEQVPDTSRAAEVFPPHDAPRGEPGVFCAGAGGNKATLHALRLMGDDTDFLLEPRVETTCHSTRVQVSRSCMHPTWTMMSSRQDHPTNVAAFVRKSFSSVKLERVDSENKGFHIGDAVTKNGRPCQKFVIGLDR